MADEISTGGGSSIGRNVDTDGGNFTGRDVVNNYESPPPGHYGPNHPVSQYTMADLVVALIGNPLAETPGLVSRVRSIESALDGIHEYQVQAVTDRKVLMEEIDNLRRHQYPLWLQILMIVLAVSLIVLVIIFIWRA